MNILKIFLVAIVSFVMMLIIMPKFIVFLKKKHISQNVSEYALEEYKNKEKTPIMGGLLFVLIPVFVYFVVNYNEIFDRKVLFAVLSYLAFCFVGLLDDYLIIIKNNNDGLSPKTRLFLEFIGSTILFFLFKDLLSFQIMIPFVNFNIEINWVLYLIFVILLFSAEVNAVNFTDGMDGLCAGVSFIGLLAFLIIAFLMKEYNIVLLIVAILFALIGYLKFNFYPAKVFMGDSGSLALGALFTSLALVLNQIVALVFIGGIFVIEMACVLIQQISVRLFHKRVFSYTPIHYAFVLKGNKETKVVLYFYLAQFILTLIGLFIGINTL